MEWKENLGVREGEWWGNFVVKMNYEGVGMWNGRRINELERGWMVVGFWCENELRGGGNVGKVSK